MASSGNLVCRLTRVDRQPTLAHGSGNRPAFAADATAKISAFDAPGMATPRIYQEDADGRMKLVPDGRSLWRAS